MDHVLEGTGKSITVKSTRERQARWISNQRASRWILEAMETETTGGTDALSAWATICFKPVLKDTGG